MLKTITDTDGLQMPNSHSISQQRNAARSCIGNTPVVQVRSIDTGCCELFLKLESQNIGGSIKDRIGLAMVEDALQRGVLKTGSHIIEATSGNTGIGLALAAMMYGLKLTLVIPDRITPLKIAHCRALGATVIITRSDVARGHPEHFQDYAERLSATTPGAVHLDQFSNPANVRAHETGTAPELFQQMHGSIDAIVCGIGSGGTLTGVGRFMKQHSPRTRMILADPVGSIIAPQILGANASIGPYDAQGVKIRSKVEGVGSDFIPAIADLSLISGVEQVADTESMGAVRELLRAEGILAGTSSGVLVAAALRYCRAQTKPQRVVTFVPDTGNKYLLSAFNESGGY